MSSYVLAHCCVQQSCIKLIADTNSHSTPQNLPRYTL